MKPLLLLLLTLLLQLPVAGPPAVRVTLRSLPDAAYTATMKSKVVTRPRTTFPLQKQRGRLVIPTTKGPRIFRDVVIDPLGEYSDSEAVTNQYLGYFPAQHCHLVHVSYYETQKWVLLSDAGERVDLWGKPVFAPDGRHLAATCEGLEYGGGQPNLVQLVELQDAGLREVWRLKPESWEPTEVVWISASSLVVTRQMWTAKSQGDTFTYAKLEIH